MMKRYLLIGLLIIVAGILWLLFGTGLNQPVPERPLVTLNPQDAAPSPGPPTVWRLVLQLKDGEVKVATALPRRGSVDKPNIDAELLLAGKAVLLEYRMVDDTGGQLATDHIVIPLTAVAEFQDPNIDNKLRRQDEILTDPWIRVTLPFDASVAAIEFSRVEPDAARDVKLWTRTPLNTVVLERAKETRR